MRIIPFSIIEAAKKSDREAVEFILHHFPVQRSASGLFRLTLPAGREFLQGKETRRQGVQKYEQKGNIRIC